MFFFSDINGDEKITKERHNDNMFLRVLKIISKIIILQIKKCFDYLCCYEDFSDKKMLTKSYLSGHINEAKYQEYCDACFEDNFDHENLKNFPPC